MAKVPPNGAWPSLAWIKLAPASAEQLHLYQEEDVGS